MAIVDGDFYLKQHGISTAEQIISNRYWLFKRIYWNDPNRTNAALLKHVFYVINTEEYMRDLSDRLYKLTKNGVIELIIKNTPESMMTSIESSIDQLGKKGQTRYQSILVLNKASKYLHSNDICSKFSHMSYSDQHYVRDKLEQEISKKYKLSTFTTDKGPLLLIDMPFEKADNKLGSDIVVLRYDGSSLPILKSSGVINGIRDSFEDQLMLLRVFLRPDVYERLNEEKKDVEKFLCEKLYEYI